MPSRKPGRRISTPAVEVEGISPWGLWIWASDHEYFVPFEAYPALKDATVRQLHDVELHHGRHLHWPALDVDIELDALVHPDRYPLGYRR